MFDRVYPHRTFPDSRRALDCFEIVDPGVNCRLVLQILAFEFDPVISRCRMQLQRDFFAGVQRRTAQAGGLANGMLKLERRSHV
jgi:hypothetical protein